MKHYNSRGFKVLRTRGSHGLFDIVAIGSSVELIQCKVTESPATAKRLLEAFRNNPPLPPYSLPVGVHQVMEVKVTGSTDVRSVTI